MDNNFTKISELEKRVSAERKELEKLISAYDGTENIFVKNKLRFLQEELEYLNNQCRLLNESVEEKAEVKTEVPVRKRAYIPEGSPAANVKPSVAVSMADVKPVEEKPAVEVKPTKADVVLDTKPAEPAKPVESSKPAFEKKPVEPEKPVEIAKPVEPAKPVAASVSVSKPELEELPDVVVAPEDTTYFERKKAEEAKEEKLEEVKEEKTEKEFEPRIRQWTRENDYKAESDNEVPLQNLKDVKAQTTAEVESKLKKVAAPNEEETAKPLAASKVETVKADVTAAAPGKEEASKVEVTKAAVPEKEEASKVEVAKTAAPQKEEAPKAEATKTAAPQKEEYKVEETVEIKMPAAMANGEKKNEKKKSSIENRIGLWVMPVLAATLIFISVILLASALPEQIGDILKQITMVVAGLSFVGIGVILNNKKIGGAFGQVLMAIGVGELFVTLAVCRFVFNSINDLVLFILILVWSTALIILKRFSSILFQVIGEIGVSIAVIFGTCYSVATFEHNGLVVVVAFYAISAFIYYFLYKFKGNTANVLLFHIFNMAKLLVLSVGVFLGTENGFILSGILGLLCVLLGFLSALDIIFTFKSESSLDEIFGPITLFLYSIQVFASSLVAIMYMALAEGGFNTGIFMEGMDAVEAAVKPSIWAMVTVGCILIGILFFCVEFFWKEKIPKYFSEALLLFVIFGSLLFSHPTFKFGFILAMIILTVLGYARENHLLKIAALCFYVGYAFIPGETVFRIAVGLGLGIATFALLYAVNNQYLFAYKISVYFSLILYAVTVSYTAFETSNIYGIRLVVILAFVSLLNLVMMFTFLSKNKEKELDFALIPEIVNLIVVPFAMILAYLISYKNGTIGFIPLVIGFIMLIVSTFRGYLQKRLLCRITAIGSLFIGVFTLTEFDYSAFWFASIAIILGIVLMYVKKESYSFTDKLLYFILILAYSVTCSYYFFEELSRIPVLGIVNICLIAAFVTVMIFKFTGLAKTSDLLKDDFSIVTFITSCAIIGTSMVSMGVFEIKASYIPFAIIVMLTYVWLIHGFIVGSHLEKIAVLVTLLLTVFVSSELRTAFSIFEILTIAIFIAFLYAKKESYHIVYKCFAYGLLLLNGFTIPLLFKDTLENIKYVQTAGIVLLAFMLVTMIFKFTILSKNPESKELDIWPMTFTADILTVLMAAVMLWTYEETGNYLPTAVIAIMTCVWLIHGFSSKRNLYKISFLSAMALMACMSWTFIPTFYVVITTLLTIMFLIMLYTDKESYSVWYKFAIFIIAMVNSVICPLLYFETLNKVEWLGVTRVILMASLVVALIFKFSPFSKNPETEEEDFYFPTFASLGLIAIYAYTLIPIYKDDNIIQSALLFIIALIWMIHGYLKERLTEKIALISMAFAIAAISYFYIPAVYMVSVLAIVVGVLFFIYRASDSYSFITKLLMYVLAAINAIICPVLIKDTLNSLEVFTVINVIFLLFFVINTLFRFTPLSKNPETDESDMKFITIAACHVLVLMGIIVTFVLEAPADILTSLLTLALVPMGTAWIWTEEETNSDGINNMIIAGKYFAITEYVFVPFILCYAMSAPAYVSSIVGIVLAVGCIVLGFVLKMKGVRIYGLVVSMIMIFKLALVDFEKSSLLAYALSFFIAGISCLVISMLYYFVNAAMAEKE